MAGRGNGKTDRFRTVFEPEDIFDRFVKNANRTKDAPPKDDDEVTGCTPRESIKRPAWDQSITVVAKDPSAGAELPSEVASEAEDSSDDTSVGVRPSLEPPAREGTKPDAPMPLAMERAFEPEGSARSVPDPESGASPLTTDSGQQVLLLTHVKPVLEPVTPVGTDLSDASDPTSHWKSVVAPRGQHTQRIEAAKLVPDVAAASKRAASALASETGEDGQMPTRELDQILCDMAVLLRYEHAGQVRDRLEQLRRAYPEDLLLLRRIAEFHVETDQIDAALEALFALARGLFERRNVEGMRQALQQVLVLDANNPRAVRLLGLLDARADGTDR